jgi:hypothetical protein
MTTDCTSTVDRVCGVSLPDGNYAIESGGQCLVRWKEERKIFPSRYEWGYRDALASEGEAGAGKGAGYCAEPLCGLCAEPGGASAASQILEGREAVWTLRRLERDLYLIMNGASGTGFKCLAFAERHAPYPSMVVWSDSAVTGEGRCVLGDGSGDPAPPLDWDPAARIEPGGGAPPDPADPPDVPCATDDDCDRASGQTCERRIEIVGRWDPDARGPEDPLELDDCERDAEGARIPDTCKPWYCGMRDDRNGPARDKLLQQGGAVWSVKQLGCEGKFCEDQTWDSLFLLRSLAGGDDNGDGLIDGMDHECLYFPTETGGAGSGYSHPRRVPRTPGDAMGSVWLGREAVADVDNNGDLECGIWADVEAGETQETALVANGQAVFRMVRLPDWGEDRFAQ